MEQKASGVCYACGIPVYPGNGGKQKPNTNCPDHIPPKNLFRHPLPSNLITVDCCHECNSRFDREIDNDIYIFLSAAESASEARRWVNDKAKRAQTRDTRLREEFLERVFRIKGKEMHEPGGLGISYDAKKLCSFMERVTKGLIRHFYPSYDYSDEIFTAIAYTGSQVQQSQLNAIAPFLIVDRRGDDEFWFMHKLADTDDPRALKGGGIWVLEFYHAITFIVFHHARA